MKQELRSMHIMVEENTEMRQEIERLKKMSYEERVRVIGEENARLKRRNGELLIQNTDLEDEVKKLKREQPLALPQQTQQPEPKAQFARPQTAHTRPVEPL